MILNTKTIIMFISCSFIVGLTILRLSTFLLKKEDNVTQNLSCVTSIEEKIVRGNSLQGLIENGRAIKVFFGYYDCNEIRRGDVIIYSYAGNSNPVIKSIKGLSGDKFHLQKSENGWHILINKEILKNSENQPYLLDERANRMLSLYEKDYQGVIPPNTYLILGNLTSGTLDSTRFGLIDKSDILGKVEI